MLKNTSKPEKMTQAQALFPSLGVCVDVWTYQDELGVDLYCKARFENATTPNSKTFRSFHHRDGRWHRTEPKFEDGKPLYNLHVLTMADQVFLVEGEKQVEALASMGIIATTSGGAKSASTANWNPLAGKEILIWADNDEPGRQYAEEAGHALRAIGCTTNRIDIDKSNLPEKGDVSDWLEQRPNLKDFEEKSSEEQQIIKDSIRNEILNLSFKGSEDGGWDSPLSLADEIEPIEFPIECLPYLIRDAVIEVQEYVQSPIAMVATCALAAASVVVQGSVDVQVSKSLQSPTSLYCLVVAESGERKSSTETYFINPIRQWEKEQSEKLADDIKRYRADKKIWSSKEEGLQSSIKKAVFSSKPTTDLEFKLQELEREEPKPIILPNLIKDNETTESLGYEMGSGWKSCGLFSSEAGAILGGHSMAANQRMAGMAFFNQRWDGAGSQVNRRSSESYRIDGARLTLALQVQPKTLSEFARSSGDLGRGIGFFARLLITFPKTTQGTRLYREEPDSWVKLGAYNSRITTLLNTPTPVDEFDIPRHIPITLSPDAHKAWINYHNAVELEMRSGGQLEAARDVGSKSANNAARIAAIFSKICSPDSAQVSEEHFNQAAIIARYYLHESLRFFSSTSVSEEIQDAQELEAWFHARTKTHGTVLDRRYCTQYGPSKLRNVSIFNARLQILIDHHRVREIKVKNKQCIEINPRLMEV
jgi:putative DNA primase/helicase